LSFRQPVCVEASRAADGSKSCAGLRVMMAPEWRRARYARCEILQAGVLDGT
jgi:hypothetical protein